MNENLNREQISRHLNNIQLSENNDLLNASSSATNSQIFITFDDLNNTDVQLVSIDSELLNILTEWNLHELYKNFKDHGIDLESLKYMKVHHIESLFSSNQLGLRIKFEKKLFDWQQVNGYSETSETCKCSTASMNTSVERWINDLTPSSPSSSDSFLDVQYILNTSERGKALVAFYKENNHLSDSHRKDLTRILIEYIYTKKFKPGPRNFEILSEKILEIFPNETKDTYFFKKKGKAPGGMLYAKYHNYLQKLKKLGEISITRAEHRDQSESIESETSTAISAECNGYELMIWLKINNEPWMLIEDKWKKCKYFRREDIKKSDLSRILERWPLYAHPSGHALIEIDFSTFYQGKETLLLLKWNSFMEKILPKLTTITEENSLNLLKKITEEENVNAESRNVVVSLLLHAILVPTSKTYIYEESNKKRRLIRSSVRDSEANFFLHVKTANDLDVKISTLTEKRFKTKTTIQPLIIDIGPEITNLGEFFVYLYPIKYKFNSFLKALDCCFKIYHVLDLQYPIECALVWTFIQKFFYEISLTCDLKTSKLSTLINDLKN